MSEQLDFEKICQEFRGSFVNTNLFSGIYFKNMISTNYIKISYQNF
jgi:hypothetical protein